MTVAAPPIPILSGIAPLAARYEAWLCDVWGVLHNGVSVFAEAAEACRRFRHDGGAVVLISNSPRPAGAVVAQLDGLGFPRQAFDSLVTSGDVTRALLRARRGAAVFHLGPERDLPLFEGLDVRLVPPQEAELVLCSGLFDDTSEGPDDYAALLTELVARGLPMLCANPDLVVERGARLVYCAGALAQAYAALGGCVTYAGKPHRPIYDLALQRLPEHVGHAVEPARILAIGDGVKTDMAGAAATGLDALYVASGVHLEGELTPGRIAALFADCGVRPIAAVARLRW